MKINDISIIALADTGSTMNFVNACCIKNLGLQAAAASKVRRMADSSKSFKISGIIKTTITLPNQTINDVCLYALQLLIVELTIGTDLQERVRTCSFHFGGDRPDLQLLKHSTSRARSVCNFQ